MNRFEAERRFAQRMKDNYPPGTRIMLLSMDDPYAPVPEGTKGTVVHVDDAAQIHMKPMSGNRLWDIPLHISGMDGNALYFRKRPQMKFSSITTMNTAV